MNELMTDAMVRQRVRINVERTSTGKYKVEKTIELTDLDLNSQADWEVANSYLIRANDLIEADVRDLQRRFAGIGKDE